MPSFTPRPVRLLSVRDFLKNQGQPAKRLAGQWACGEYTAYLYDRAINLLLCRNIEQNMRGACMIGVGLTLKYPDDKVLLINTYAGQDLIQQSMVWALGKMDQKVPQDFLTTHACERTSDEAEEIVPRLWVVDVPMGTWDTEKIDEAIEKTGAHYVVLNSFEFASIRRSDKSRIAAEIIELREKWDLSITIFSHEMRRDLRERCGGRGAVGLLCAYAESVTRFMEDWEHNRLSSMEKQVLHEQKMRAKKEAEFWTKEEMKWKKNGYKPEKKAETGDLPVQGPAIATVQAVEQPVEGVRQQNE